MTDPRIGPVRALPSIIWGTLATALCALTAAPGVAWLDAGDFATASAELGVPHATGFPIYTVAGHALSWLPLGGLAHRVALASALFAGATVALCAAAACAWSGRRSAGHVVGLTSTLALFVAPAVAIHARVPEVYSLNTALLAACIYLVIRAGQEPWQPRWGLLLAATIGAGIANHALFRLWAPVFVAALVTIPAWRSARRLVAAAAFGLTALLAYAYLPVAAARHPWHNWGDPSSPRRFWEHVNATAIQEAFAHQMSPTLYAGWVHLDHLADQLVEASGLLWIGGLVILGLGWRRAPRVAGLLVGIVLIELAYSSLINPMGLRDLQNGQATLTVTLALFGLGIGLPAADMRGRLRLGALALVALLSLPLLTVTGPDDGMQTRGDFGAEELALIQLGYGAPQMVTATVSDTMTAASTYATVALGARPDAAVLGRNELSDGRAFAYTARRMPFPVVSPDVVASWQAEGRGTTDRAFRQRAGRVVAENIAERAVYWEVSGSGDDLPAPFGVRHAWPLGLATTPPPEGDVRACDSRRSLCGGLLDAAFAFDARVEHGVNSRPYRAWLASQWGYIGKQFFAAGDIANARVSFESAQQLNPLEPAWPTNLAVCLAAAGAWEAALDTVLGVTDRHPLSEQALRNARLYATRLGRAETVARIEEQASRIGLLMGSR